MRSNITKAIALSFAAAAASLSFAPVTHAAVLGCDATGSKQETGAVIGALLGGLAGNRIAGHNRGTGTVVGAVAGAAAGSAIGCSAQRTDRARADVGPAAYEGAYRSNGYRFASNVSAVRLQPLSRPYAALSTVNLRASPSTAARRTGQLQRGERFQALGATRSGQWILVGQDGVGVGYVHGAYVTRVGGYQRTNY